MIGKGQADILYTEVPVSGLLASRFGAEAAGLFGKPDQTIEVRAQRIALRIRGHNQVHAIATYLDPLIPSLGMSSLNTIIVKIAKHSPSLAASLPFLSKRLAHVYRAAEIALLFDVRRLNKIRSALEEYHSDNLI